MKFLAFLSVVLSFTAVQAFAYDKAYVGETIHYDAAYEDTFVHLARDYGLGFVEMRAANPGIDPWLPGAGTDLILPTRHLLPDAPREGIVINLPEMRLYAFVEKDAPPQTFPLGVGRDGLETPLGTTHIRAKAKNPQWRPTARMRREDPELPEVVQPGPENPLGNRVLYLAWPQYAIHGTNRPFGIGRRISSGCIRLYPEDIETLYEMIETGTKVTVVDQPIKVGWIKDRLYLEVHPTLERSMEVEEQGAISAPSLSEESMQLIVRAAGDYEDALDWPKIRKAVQESKGYPIFIAKRPKGTAKKIAAQKSEEEIAEALKKKKASSEDTEESKSDKQDESENVEMSADIQRKPFSYNQ